MKGFFMSKVRFSCLFLWLLLMADFCCASSFPLKKYADWTLLSELYLRYLLMPSDKQYRDESLVDYIIGALEDSAPSPYEFNGYDAQNLYAMLNQQQSNLFQSSASMRDVMLQGYVSSGFSTSDNFLYEINRSLMVASTTSLAMYDEKPTLTASESTDNQPMAYTPAKSLVSIDNLLKSSPYDEISLSAKSMVTQYNLRQRVPGSEYEKIGDFLNQLTFVLFSSYSCGTDYLENQCIPCSAQKNASHYDAVMYQDVTNSSCTMRPDYKNQPWNGMPTFIGSLKDLIAGFEDPSFLKSLPSSYVNSPSYQAYKNGIVCLASDLVSIYEKNGNWYDFFHWSTFSNAPECTALIKASGRQVSSSDNSSSASLSSFLYAYFFDPAYNTDSGTVALSIDAINVVNIIDGFLQSAESSNRLSADPSRNLMQALGQILLRMRSSIQAQASRSVVDLTSDLASTAQNAESILPDQAYLMSTFLDSYNLSSYEWSEATSLTNNVFSCRYQGLDQVLSNESMLPDQSIDYTTQQQNIIRELVGQGSLSSPLVGFQKSITDLLDVKIGTTVVPKSAQVAFLKYGKFNLAGRYQDAGTGAYRYGIILPSGSKQVSAQFSLPRMVDLTQDNQAEVQSLIESNLKAYNQSMNRLILQRIMIAYVYEYLSASTMSTWSGKGRSDTQLCPLSPDAQIEISSTWRKDPANMMLSQMTTTSNAKQSNQTASSDVVVQYPQSLSTWDGLETMRDEAFQLAKSNYMKYLKYKIKELMLVLQSAVFVQNLDNSAIVTSFASTYASADKNVRSFVLVDSIPSSVSNGGGLVDDSGTVDSDAVQSASGQPSDTVSQMISDSVSTSSCPNIN
jgi:hypothetical protein